MCVVNIIGVMQHTISMRSNTKNIHAFTLDENLSQYLSNLTKKKYNLLAYFILKLIV